MYHRAIFIRRNNRFEVECLLNGKVVRAYLPNPGRLWEILLPGKELYLKENSNNSTKHSFTVWAAKRYGTPVLLHTHHTNVLAEQLIKEGAIPDLRGFEIEQKEVSISGSKIDFLLKSSEGVRLLLEIKSCTLFGERIAMFPDAITDRGKRHVEALAKIASEIRAGILFMVHADRISYFLPDFHTDPAFSRTLYENRKTLMLKAASIRWNQNLEPHFAGMLDIPWQIYEREAGDRGSYIIVGFLPKSMDISIGSLGERLFRKGFYIYVGSAMKSLSRRIRRHMLRRKPEHWHIDTLTPFLQKILPLRIESSERLECHIAKALNLIADSTIKHFGSSDCNCPGHLFWMASNPLLRESFINLLIDYRINRLFQWHQDNGQE
ncbi:MAG: DNA/RNA nuclease SfsA [Syntrophobacterales bacterium]|nr:DNA/RNA nuclease SfsA [Syntrophobacterales bacterium]